MNEFISQVIPEQIEGWCYLDEGVVKTLRQAESTAWIKPQQWETGWLMGQTMSNLVFLGWKTWGLRGSFVRQPNHGQLMSQAEMTTWSCRRLGAYGVCFWIPDAARSVKMDFEGSKNAHWKERLGGSPIPSWLHRTLGWCLFNSTSIIRIIVIRILRRPPWPVLPGVALWSWPVTWQRRFMQMKLRLLIIWKGRLFGLRWLYRREKGSMRGIQCEGNSVVDFEGGGIHVKKGPSEVF